MSSFTNILNATHLIGRELISFSVPPDFGDGMNPTLHLTFGGTRQQPLTRLELQVRVTDCKLVAVGFKEDLG